MLFAEELFGFADLGALQVADLGCDLVERGRDHRQRGQVMRVPVALDHLGRNVGGFQSQACADALFEFGRKMREGTDCARKLAHPHVFRGGCEARDVALRLGIPVGEFETEGDGLGVHAVSAADLGVSLNSQARRSRTSATAAPDLPR